MDAGLSVGQHSLVASVSIVARAKGTKVRARRSLLISIRCVLLWYSKQQNVLVHWRLNKHATTQVQIVGIISSCKILELCDYVVDTCSKFCTHLRDD